MHRSVLNQQLNREPTMGIVRKVIDSFHFHNLSVKTGFSIFGGTLLVGTGVVLASAQANSSINSVTPNSVAISAQARSNTLPVTSVLDAQTADTSNNSFNNSDHTTNDQSNASSSYTKVTVNGQPIVVPANGSVHQTVSNGNGNTNVDVTAQSSSQNGTTTYTNVQTNNFTSGTNTTTTNTTTQSGVNN